MVVRVVCNDSDDDDDDGNGEYDDVDGLEVASIMAKS